MYFVPRLYCPYLQEKDRLSGDASESNIERHDISRVGQTFACKECVPAEHLAMARADRAWDIFM